ncbi:MAG: MMPL family transporter, partial [Chloroflexi bacterium]|nr:MMPL family transporter [Chloroflexota bacterium]
ATVVLTFLLIIPLLLMADNGEASQDPKDEAFTLRDQINERFDTQIHYSAYIVESKDSEAGDVLTQATLWELYQNQQALIDKDEQGELAPAGLEVQPYLYTAYDIDSEQSYVGTYSLASAVADMLVAHPLLDTTLEHATDNQVKIALHYILAEDADTSGFTQVLSVKRTSEPKTINTIAIDYWTSPALWLEVFADNEKLGGGSAEITLGGDETLKNKEQFNRNIQSSLRGDEQTYNLWGIAIDVTLEAEDEGFAAGTFIMFTVIAVILIAAIAMRSYWAVILTGAGLGILMIWLKGISALIGIKGGMVIDMIVPISMLSLGVDFALHSFKRYDEEKRRGLTPKMALRAGFIGVLGALTLAMASDSVAFLSNVSSGIESVIHFGIAAGIAVAASYVVLGLVLPAAMMHIDRMKKPALTVNKRQLSIALGYIGMASMTGLGILILVAVSAPIGTAILLITIALFVGLPLWYIQNKNLGQISETVAQPQKMSANTDASQGWFPNLIASIARYRVWVISVAVALTIGATIFAFKLEASLDAKDFFKSSSDFVVSLDKMDIHGGDQGGEGATIYIEGDLTDPGALSAMNILIANLADNPDIVKNSDGSAQIFSGHAIDLLRRLTSSQYDIDQILTTTGVQITDANEDRIPDSAAQIEAAYTYMLSSGIHTEINEVIYTVFTAGQIQEKFFHDPEGIEPDVSLIHIAIPGTREQKNVTAAFTSLTEDIKVLADSEAITKTGLTGSPITRVAQFNATTETLQRSLPIAAVITLLLLLLTLRSFRYAIVTIVPIALVIAWLYGLMYLTGFALNFITATIGAISLGVGIDYSIHMTERFREEMKNTSSRLQALRQAAGGTGIALLGSAASSIVGFTIMGFAPMPMFSAFGILTALMIFLALIASMVVLPSLLLLVTPKKKKQ